MILFKYGESLGFTISIYMQHWFILLILSACLVWADEKDYTLQAEDVVAITVFQEDDLNKKATIDRSGNAAFNLIGSVKLSGLTVSEAEEMLTELYERDYLKNTQLSLEVVSYAMKWVVVVGDVANPGLVDLRDKEEALLSSVLTLSGGIIGGSKDGEIYIERDDAELDKMAISKSDSVKVKHGDMITVRIESRREKKEQEIKVFTVSGEVNRPGQVTLPSSGKMNIVTAIASAGSFKGIANKRDITVKRLTADGKYKLIKLDMKKINSGQAPMFYMQEDDIVQVKERIF